MTSLLGVVTSAVTVHAEQGTTSFQPDLFSLSYSLTGASTRHSGRKQWDFVAIVLSCYDELAKQFFIYTYSRYKATLSFIWGYVSSHLVNGVQKPNIPSLFVGSIQWVFRVFEL